MTEGRVYNFSAGPSVLPEPVLQRARAEMMNYRGTGMSVMEMSHRSPAFSEIFTETKEKFRSMLRIPDSHEILFLQGGATLQFAAVPMNLMEGKTADYAVTGNFSGKAAKEAEKYGTVRLACNTEACGHSRIPAQEELCLNPDAKYFYYCSNNTIYGTEWQYVPQTAAPLVCDMSSDILSRPVDVARYGLIFAGAQKNMAPAGLTVVIADRSLTGRELPYTPQIMSYKTMIEHDSLLNTPPCWCIYMLSLVLDWLQEQGGVEGMEQGKRERAKLVYDFLDGSRLFRAHAEPGSRSDMNVTFRTGDDGLDAEFIAFAARRGLVNLKGHKIAGGMRASLYNAMPLEGAGELVRTMKEFERKHV
ncbi:MAG: 3-phosphoserine/phosphohydroxythreonine transaminase [Oscillospiraceae bacterium]|jgi:phosphoserine aminotransferase|nr:3-phosphoserine/phosphohydroxythreonine transaminase [Oscillospiraceae bacterium]